jgi:exopolyphosphatase/guanosine-5'-triphosphate,3'-diphosphate pyrophosphatase
VERRLAVIDLGSNSFRLVVFTYTDAWWKRTDEIYEPVRVGEGQAEGGALRPAPMERALETIELFAHFCRATGIEDVRPLATSAIREASNREELVAAARERAQLEIEVLSREEEARYGYLAAVNSTTLADGVALDIGGGSMQLTQVAARRARAARSWRLGAVVTTERSRQKPCTP